MATYRISWPANDAAEQIEKYVVYQSYQGGPYTVLDEVLAPDTFLDIVDPAQGSYSWRVAAVNLYGEGSHSPTVSGPQVPSPVGQPAVVKL